MMFHYLKLSVCDAWTAQDTLFAHLTENWENMLEMIEGSRSGSICCDSLLSFEVRAASCRPADNQGPFKRSRTGKV